MIKPNIRKARIEDKDKLLLLWSKLIEMHTTENKYFEVKMNYRDYLEKDIETFFKNENFQIFLAEHNLNIIGFGVALKTKRPSIFAIEDRGHINDLFVDENYRNNKVGSLITDAIKIWFKENGINFVTMQVAKFNEGGLKFWESNNFQTINYQMSCEL